jgi:hypothetical protein
MGNSLSGPRRSISLNESRPGVNRAGCLGEPITHAAIGGRAAAATEKRRSLRRPQDRAPFPSELGLRVGAGLSVDDRDFPARARLRFGPPEAPLLRTVAVLEGGLRGDGGSHNGSYRRFRIRRRRAREMMSLTT